MKKVAISFLIIIVLTLLAIWSPWDNLISNTKSTNKDLKYSSLILNSLGGEVVVYIDEVEKGRAIFGEDPLEINTIQSGNHSVKFTRIGSVKGSYKDLETDIYFEEGIATVAALELGPSLESTSGYIISAVVPDKSFDGEAALDVETNPKKSKAYLNDELIGSTPMKNYKLDTTNNYKIRIESEGYLPLEASLLPDDNESKTRFAGSNIRFVGFLYKLPIDTNDTQGEN